MFNCRLEVTGRNGSKDLREDRDLLGMVLSMSLPFVPAPDQYIAFEGEGFDFFFMVEFATWHVRDGRLNIGGRIECFEDNGVDDKGELVRAGFTETPRGVSSRTSPPSA